MKYLFLFISLQSFAQNGALSNYVFTYGPGCLGNTWSCFGEEIVFYADYTCESRFLEIIHTTYKRGYYSYEGGIITTFFSDEAKVYRCGKEMSVEQAKIFLSNRPNLQRRYTVTKCTNGLALQEYNKQNLGGFYLRKFFGGHYLDSTTHEEIHISEDFTISGSQYSLSVGYRSSQTNDQISLKILSIQKENRNLLVQFPNDNQFYTLSWPESQKGLICVNPDGKTQFFMRTAEW